MEDIQNIWQRISEILESEMTQASFDTWIDPLIPKEINDEENKITVITNNEFAKNLISNRYISTIENAILEVTSKKYKLIIELDNSNNNVRNELVYDEEKFDSANTMTNYEKLYLNPKYNFGTFVIGKNNELAHAAAMAVAKSPAIKYNPLFLYGDAGLGKTHLMHAIGHYVLQNNINKKVLYVSSEMFTNELVNAIQNKTAEEFRSKYRNIDVLMIDDIQFIAKKERTQEEIFHTFNTLYGANKQIVLTSDRPPKEIPTIEARLRSRFESGLIADIQPPDYETRVAILKNKAEIEDITTTDELLEVFYLIAEKITSNIRELEGAFNRVVAFANLTGRNVSKEMAKEVLKDIFTLSNRQITPDLIKQVVCTQYSIDIHDIESAKRTKQLAHPRQIAMYLCRDMTELSLPKIGEYFGNRDHTTVMHACDKISKLVKIDNNLRNEIEEIKGKLTDS